ncbi:pectate lyase superfamily protein-domain-containing protein [Cercophora newfieldiana]|uniref:Pectate lyase superfamily protein-domain-containing protein n=1 Tax=Cercophora newfieldiana TaxID=92897 RepID=A0AA39YSM8_9PEZI|nr:pectate lyase superfamily protein-domain-containing protein [Cercophora newfieldiana]
MLRPFVLYCATVTVIWSIMRRFMSAPKIPSLMDATLDDLTHGLTQGHFTSAQLVRTYAARVAEVNHVFHAVIKLNPDAEEIASRLNQERAGKGPRSDAVKNAIVYFPPGTYLVSGTIALPFGTQVIGDANNRPLILAASSFKGLGVLSTDEYTGSVRPGADGLDEQYYINTANFYRQLRNVRIDVRNTDPTLKISCLHYQVAQATSTQNLELIAGPSQKGIFAENGSGGGISDITFTGGAYGILGGNQQFTAQRLTFNGCAIGVHVFWDWGWVWKSITMNNVETGFILYPEDGGTGHIGSASFLDSTFNNVGTVIFTFELLGAIAGGTTGVIIENTVFSGVNAGLITDFGRSLLDGGSRKIDHWAVGRIYSGTAASSSWSRGEKIGNFRRSPGLTDVATGAYFERPKPQYADRPLSDFLHVRDFGATGNGVTDDTAAFQNAVDSALGKVLFVDAGSYILTKTLTIPTGTKIVDASNPKVLLQVGRKGEIGSVELQDLIITTKGPTAGAVLIEWNMESSGPGEAALWDVHVRIGGATGTGLTPDECPAVRSGVNANCNAASLMMHLTPTGSGYFENMWLWLADHDIDDPLLDNPTNNMEQTSVYAARGFLIESTKPTWLYGTASEHAVFYQYNFHKARNIFAGMIQTESPYYQPTPPPPAPFKNQVGLFPGDPDYTCAAGEFNGCDQSWGLIIRQSTNILVAGAGLYSWFSTYTQCIDSQTCQKALVLLDKNGPSVRIQHLITIGAKYMVVMNGVGIEAFANLNVNVHPFWSSIAVLDVKSNTTQFEDVLWIDPKVWDMPTPAFTCSPPCTVQLLPWTKAMSTVNYPLLTVSSGTWKSTITVPPITVSKWAFKRVTVTTRKGAKRDVIGDGIWPVPLTTSTWPAVIYTGPNGSPTTVTPTATVPKPPASIGPNAAPPPAGSWPTKAVRAIQGLVAAPLVDECVVFGEGCNWDPKWITPAFDPENDYDGGLHFLKRENDCPDEPHSSSTRTTSISSAPTQAKVNPSPKANHVSCNDRGQVVDNSDFVAATETFCDYIGGYSDYCRPFR